MCAPRAHLCQEVSDNGPGSLFHVVDFGRKGPRGGCGAITENVGETHVGGGVVFEEVAGVQTVETVQ